MTRETKIGLLVGLAFIIVIGILLSDHLTSATEPQQAQLAQVAGNVRNGVAVPGGAQAQPPITQVAPPVDVAPQQPVMTKEELTPRQPPVEIVKIGGPANPPPVAPTQQQQPPAHPETSSAKPQTTTTNNEPPITVVDTSTTTSTPQVKPLDPSKNPLARVAEAFKEEIVPVGADETPKSEPTKPTIAAAALPPGARHYKAASGDTVSRLASRFLGGDTKANRDAILAVNPTLQKNPDIIVLGRTYVIPAAPTASAAPAPLPTTPVVPPPVVPPPIEVAQAPVTLAPTPPAAPNPATAAPESFYIVKPNDTLTKIAVEQLGSRAGVPALMDLNKELLKGTDRIRPNMKLRLPAKPMAAAM
jgi:nucleoid-associated protein YgaU